MRSAMKEMVNHFGTTAIEVFEDIPGHAMAGFWVETVRVDGEYFDVLFRHDYSIDHVNRDGA